MRLRKTKVLMPVMVLICAQCLAMEPFPKGNDWMGWNAETRLAYVAAYVQEYVEGFRVGCDAGKEAYATKIPKNDTGERCVGRGKTFSKSEEDYVDKITEFYQSYPADRHVQVGRVLEGLCDERQLTPNKCTCTMGRSGDLSTRETPRAQSVRVRHTEDGGSLWRACFPVPIE